MNNLGQIEGAIEGILFALVAGITLYIFLVLWSPIASILFPLLDNSETIALGGPAKFFLMLIPAILVLTIIIGILMRIKGRPQQPAYY